MGRVSIPTTPNFYSEANAFNYNYTPDMNTVFAMAEAWRKQYGIKPNTGRNVKVELLLIDEQEDFAYPEGSLFVAGQSGKGGQTAIKNSAEFIYSNIDLITEIICTMDFHLPNQVFYPTAHMKADGTSVDINTSISAADYSTGKYIANPRFAAEIGADQVWLTRQWKYYCEQLEKSGKYQLFIWPFHCMGGSRGQRLAGVIQEARMFHSFITGASNLVEVKGGSPFVEHYSIFGAESNTLHNGSPIPGVQKNVRLIYRLLKADMIIMGGLAGSHCFKFSAHDLKTHILDQDPELMKLIGSDPKFTGVKPEDLLKKIYILEDCIAPVVIPGVVDFTPQQDEAIEEFRASGINIVNSKTPISQWPGIASSLTF